MADTEAADAAAAAAAAAAGTAPMATDGGGADAAPVADRARAAAAAGPGNHNQNQASNQPWIEKYRPRTLDDVAAHKDIIDTIKRLTAENRLPHLLLYGPPGTGKTSTVLAVARQIYGAKQMPSMVLELNASDDRGIAVVRQEIQEFASTRSVFSRQFKLVVLDECDAMTKDAQFALRRVIEKYTRNARFCLICNYVSKVIPALQSRCTRFRFAPLSAADVRARLDVVVSAEGVTLGEGGMEALVTLGCGDMRRTLNILQSCHMSAAVVDEKAVYATAGAPRPADVADAARWLLNDPFNVCLRRIQRLQVDKGVALADIVRELQPWVFRIESLPPATRIDLVEALADAEHRLAYGSSEPLQLGALVAAFGAAKASVAAAAV